MMVHSRAFLLMARSHDQSEHERGGELVAFRRIPFASSRFNFPVHFRRQALSLGDHRHYPCCVVRVHGAGDQQAEGEGRLSLAYSAWTVD